MDERMEEARQGFLAHLAAKGYSREVMADYREDLEVFLAFLGVQGVKDLKAVGESQLRAYGEWVAECRNQKTKEPLSAATKASRFRSVKRFFRWMEWTGWVLVDPSGVLQVPPSKKHQPPKPLNQEEVEGFLSAPDPSTAGGIRARAILEMWYGAGLKPEELEGLTLADVSTVDGFIRVSGRMVPLDEQACQRLQSYLREVRPKWVLGQPPTEALWVSTRGEAVAWTGLWQAVRRYVFRVGLSGVGLAGRLRASRAVEWLRQGVGQEEVGRRLGMGKGLVEEYAKEAEKLTKEGQE